MLGRRNKPPSRECEARPVDRLNAMEHRVRAKEDDAICGRHDRVPAASLLVQQVQRATITLVIPLLIAVQYGRQLAAAAMTGAVGGEWELVVAVQVNWSGGRPKAWAAALRRWRVVGRQVNEHRPLARS